MNDPRDYSAFVTYGNLGVLLLGVGLFGILIHTKSARRAMSAGVGLLGVLLIAQGGALFHRAQLSLRGSIVLAAVAIASCLFLRFRPSTPSHVRKPPAS
jgi:hypothetical protein